MFPGVLQHGAPDAVGVVDALNRCLPSGAELSLINRMKRIPLYLDDASFPVLGKHAASGRTLPAGRCIPGCNTGNDVFGRKEIRDKPG